MFHVKQDRVRRANLVDPDDVAVLNPGQQPAFLLEPLYQLGRQA